MMDDIISIVAEQETDTLEVIIDTIVFILSFEWLWG